MSPVLAGFLVYLVLILVVGVLTSRYVRSQSDFILGGRKLGPWVIAFSERASGESAWLLIGLPGAALASGFAEIWTIIGCTSGILFSWLVIAKRLRTECERFDDLTLPDFFMNRFPEATVLLRIAASALIAFFFTFYVASQIQGSGTVLVATFPELLDKIRQLLSLDLEPKTIGMIVGSLIIVFYTIMGGFLAVAWTDLVQGIIMIFTLVVLPIALFLEVNAGKGAGMESLDRGMLLVTGGKTGLALWLAVIGGLSWGLGYMGQPHLLARFKAIRSPRDIRKGALIAVFWAVPAFWGAFLVGILGLAFYGPGVFSPADAEKIMPQVTLAIIPTWLAGVMISGAVAAMMSTADSQLLVTSSTLSEDIFHKLFRRDADQRTLVVFSRGITLAVGVFAFYLAVHSEKLVYEMVSYAWSGLSASFGPPLLLTLWWKGTRGFGVLAGMVTGAATVICWTTQWFSKLYVLVFFDAATFDGVRRFFSTGGDSGIDPASLMVSHRFSGFFVSLFTVIAVSLLTRKMGRER